MSKIIADPEETSRGGCNKNKWFMVLESWQRMTTSILVYVQTMTIAYIAIGYHRMYPTHIVG